MATDPKIEIGQ